ncbi:MAG: flippase [Magnetococcales bacterium]|nr:flippase [Magnetococcales bacterium]
MDAPRVIKNSIFISSSLMFSGVIFFLNFVQITRYLGKERFGEFIFIVSLTVVFQIFADGGITNILVREISRNKSKAANILSATRSLVWVITIILSSLLVACIAIVEPEPVMRNTILLLAGSSLASFHAFVLTSVVRAFEDMGTIALAAITHKVFLFIVVMIFIQLDYGMEGVAFGHLVTNFIHWCFFRILVAYRYVKIIFRIDPTYWKFLIGQAAPLGAGMMLRRLTIHIDTFLLTAISTVAATGLFNSAYRMTQMIEGATLAVCGVLFPILSQLAHKDPEKFQQMSRITWRILVALIAPIAGWLMVSSQWLMITIYGAEFVEAAPVLAILGFSLIFLVPGSLVFFMLSALNHQRLFLVITLIGVATNILLDILLIPQFDYIGATWATLSTEMILLTSALLILRREGITLQASIIYLRVLPTTGASLIPLWLLLSNDPSLQSMIIGTLLLIIIYPIVTFFSGLLTDEQLDVIKSHQAWVRITKHLRIKR